MSAYTLTPGSESALAVLLATGGHELVLLTQPAAELRGEVTLETAGAHLQAQVTFGEHRDSIRLQAADGANAQHLADFIEAVANGRIEGGEPACTRATSAPERPLLSPEDEASLRHICRHGGTRELPSVDALVTVHLPLAPAPMAALVSQGGATSMTESSIHRPGQLYVRLAEQLEAAWASP